MSYESDYESDNEPAQESDNEPEPEPLKVKCPECGRTVKPKSLKQEAQYHKKCWTDYTNRLLFRAKIMGEN
jgi:acetyl-CoA carboxylase beta subunit